jgi:putative transposase
MKKPRSTDEIVGLLRQADVDLGKGANVPDGSRRLDISQQTYYRWRMKFGGMDPMMAKQLQELQKENSRLKKLVADQALDMLILKEAARPNGRASSVAAGRWNPSGGPWGTERSQKEGAVESSARTGARSVTVQGRLTVTASCSG